MKKVKLKEEVASEWKAQELKDFILKKDKIQSRTQTAQELGCSKTTLRLIAKELGIVRPQGRPTKILMFKDEQ